MAPKLISPDTWHLRQQVLQKYGGVCSCGCGCQERRLKTLQIDHTLGEGTTERKKLRGDRWYTHLLKPITPDPTLQLLCANCHHAKNLFGVCDLGFHADGSKASETHGTEGDQGNRHGPMIPTPEQPRGDYLDWRTHYPTTAPHDWTPPPTDETRGWFHFLKRKVTP